MTETLEQKLQRWQAHYEAVIDNDYSKAYDENTSTRLANEIIQLFITQRGGYDGG